MVPAFFKASSGTEERERLSRKRLPAVKDVGQGLKKYNSLGNGRILTFITNVFIVWVKRPPSLSHLLLPVLCSSVEAIIYVEGYSPSFSHVTHMAGRRLTKIQGIMVMKLLDRDEKQSRIWPARFVTKCPD